MAELDISGIPTYVIDGHQEAYYLWDYLGVKNRQLVHVDAHHDLGEGARVVYGDFYAPTCGSYLLPSVKKDIVDSVWWINPFSVTGYCYNLVSSSEKPEIITRNDGSGSRIYWGDSEFLRDLYFGEEINHPMPILEDRPYILDIDLDAFSCCRAVPAVEFPENAVGLSQSVKDIVAQEYYHERIDKFLNTLSHLPDPEMIMIAESQEVRKNKTYISPRFVEPVKRDLMGGLETLFSSR